MAARDHVAPAASHERSEGEGAGSEGRGLTTEYQRALDFLFPRTTQIKFGLDTTRALLAAAGRPQHQFPTIHVAGTNGKGSVSTLIAAALRASGLRVGLYTSPHLISFTERIQIDGVPISEEAVAVWTAALRPAIVELDATFFEATTAIAFAHFAAREVDIAVIEVGLGGRLDSTNVITPLVSVITHVELDHQKYLGDTVELIAAEKAAITKPGVPLVVGETNPSIVQVIRDVAQRTVRDVSGGDAAVHIVPAKARWTGALRLHGPHQRRNAAVALAALQQLPEALRPSDAAIEAAFATATIPGRLDRRGKWLFDVAHNPDSMRALVAALRAGPVPGPVHALVSILGDKEWSEMLVELDQVIDAGVLTVAPSADARRWDLGWLERWLADDSRPRARAVWRLEPDFAKAIAEVQQGAGTVVVAGSFHTVGDVMLALGMSVER